jgi:hypothetical protein
MEAQLGDELGRGGYGIVYVDKANPGRCIKVSNKNPGNESCRQWSNEYKKITSFMDRIVGHPLYKKLDMARVVAPHEFIETNGACYMILPRVFRPEGRGMNMPTLQAQLGWPAGRMVHKGRGEFIGLKEILEYVSVDEVLKACYDLGILMGLIHHIGRNDAYDVEVYLGKEANSKKCRFYVADFDLSEQVKEYDEDTIERMIWSLDAVPYFPREVVDISMFKVFREGYEKVVPVDIAAKVFEGYG